MQGLSVGVRSTRTAGMGLRTLFTELLCGLGTLSHVLRWLVPDQSPMLCVIELMPCCVVHCIMNVD